MKIILQLCLYNGFLEAYPPLSEAVKLVRNIFYMDTTPPLDRTPLLLLQLQPRFSWHECARCRSVVLLELIGHFLHGYELYSFVLLKVLNQPLMHEQ